jgi:hypothetical protein
MGRGEQGDSHTIITEWGGGWAVPSQERVVPERRMVNLRCNIFL